MIVDVLIIAGGIVGVSIAYCLDLKKPRGAEQSCWKSRGGDRGLLLLGELDKAFEVKSSPISS